MGDLWIGSEEDEGAAGRSADPRISDLARHSAARGFPALEQVLTYWSDLARSEGQVPPRRQVEPRALSGALPMVFILESVAPGVARFRVAGSQICDLMGMEVRGMPLISIFAPKSRDAISGALQTVLGRLAQAQLTLAGESGFGRPPLEARMLLLPLMDDFGKPTRALGALEAKGKIGRTPRRFEVTAEKIALLRQTALTAVNPLDADPLAPAARNNWRAADALSRPLPAQAASTTASPAASPAEGFSLAESPASFDFGRAEKLPTTPDASSLPPPPEGARGRPWLRVIQGGKS